MELTPVFIVGFIVLGIYKLVELNARKDERKMLIEKLGELAKKSDETPTLNFPDISFGSKNTCSWALRISLLMMGIGLGCLVDFFIRVIFANEIAKRLGLIDLADAACITLFGGLGMFIAFIVERTKKD
jgi:hypothetical protein